MIEEAIGDSGDFFDGAAGVEGFDGIESERPEEGAAFDGGVEFASDHGFEGAFHAIDGEDEDIGAGFFSGFFDGLDGPDGHVIIVGVDDREGGVNFEEGFGDLFVTRIAGNVASSENIGSLEFGTKVLGAKVLYVLGHTSCGAVIATMKGDEVPGQISGLFQHIRPAVKTANGDLDRAISENVRNQAILLAEASPTISKLVQRKELIVAGGVYDLSTGLVTAVDVAVN